MIKELEMFETLCATYIWSNNYFITDGETKILLSIKIMLERYEKQQRILDILKDKLCLELWGDHLCLKSHKGQEADYTILFFDTQEEYDLLKEWLKND